MIVQTSTPELLRHVAERMSEKDVEKLRAMAPGKSRAELVETFLERYAAVPGLFAFGLAENDPIAVIGFMQVRPNVITLMMICTDDLHRIILPLTKWLRKEFSAMEMHDIHRIESLILASQDEIRKWLPMLGLGLEGTFYGFGSRGETYVQYARLAGAPAHAWRRVAG